MDHGWSWRIEFENHVTRGYVFSSQFCDDDTAADELVKNCPELESDLRPSDTAAATSSKVESLPIIVIYRVFPFLLGRFRCR